MATHPVFCSACDREVILVPRSSETLWPMVLAPDSTVEVECLDQGVTCTGALCPFCAVEPLDRAAADSAVPRPAAS